MTTCRYLSFMLIVLWGLLLNFTAMADSRIAVLEFELKDLTLQPAPEEQQRLAMISQLMRSELAEQGFQIVPIASAVQSAADAGVGYLFDRPQTAAQLGAAHRADYIAIGRVHKPSFLFVYLKVRLVDVYTKQLIGDYVVELKGSREKLARRGVQHIVRQLQATLAKHS